MTKYINTNNGVETNDQHFYCTTKKRGETQNQIGRFLSKTCGRVENDRHDSALLFMWQRSENLTNRVIK